MSAPNSRWRMIGCFGLLLLIVGTFCLDVYHGKALGQDRITFDPIYRLRQSLAVAISRLHQPSAGGYLAYKSVVDVFNRNGFALFDGEPGPHLDKKGWEALFNDGPLLDRVIAEASTVAVDPALPPEIIRGNELGFADYMYLSFRMFGAKVSSLYYFFFTIVAVTSLLYILQFRRSPFLLFLLAIFLAELYLLENNARSFGTYENTVTNSRLFSGLSLVPALHVLIVLWQRQPVRALTVAGVVAQSLIFAFLLSCRTEAAWQFALISAVACGMGVVLLLRRGQGPSSALGRVGVLWPAAIFVAVVAAYSAAVSMSADRRYAVEPKVHILWHEVLLGLLGASPELQLQYVGNDVPINVDQQVYKAVLRDINARNDSSSPIVHRGPDGQLTFDLMEGWAGYEELVKSLTLRIIADHPLAVLQAMPNRIERQFHQFAFPYTPSTAWENLRVPAVIATIAALLCMAAGGLPADRQTARGGFGIGAVILIFAAITPLLIHPSPLAIGTLFCYLGAIAVLLSYAMALAIRMLARTGSRARKLSSGIDSGS